MWWHGIPPSVRGKVWKLAFGNDLNITQGKIEVFRYNIDHSSIVYVHNKRVGSKYFPQYCMCTQQRLRSPCQSMQTDQSDPEVIKSFSCSTQLSMKFSLLINMKMPTIVGIFIFISRENFMLSYV